MSVPVDPNWVTIVIVVVIFGIVIVVLKNR